MTVLSLSPVDLVLRVARGAIGAGEVGGPNAGPFVERCQRVTGNKPPDPWCASFVAEVGTVALPGLWPVPLSGSCAALGHWAETRGILKTEPQAGDIFLLYFPSLGRFAHTGFIEVPGDVSTTVDGNTNDAGSREGWLVARKSRRFGAHDRFIRWTEALA